MREYAVTRLSSAVLPARVSFWCKTCIPTEQGGALIFHKCVVWVSKEQLQAFLIHLTFQKVNPIK